METCRRLVAGGTNIFHTRNCRRPVFKDGLCKIHQPEAIRARDRKREEAFEERSRVFRAPYEEIARLHGQVILLRQALQVMVDDNQHRGQEQGMDVNWAAINKGQEALNLTDDSAGFVKQGVKEEHLEKP